MATAEELPHEPAACDAALTRAFAFLGKRWNGVIIGSLVGGPAAFSEIRRAVRGISDSVLSDRLSELTEAGIVQREVGEGPPVAVSYRLTPSGHALIPALTELTIWAREHLPG
jgi:DNA-binding HxlR family transcriptional regulator